MTDTLRNASSTRRSLVLLLVVIFLHVVAPPAAWAQTVVQSASPTLAELVKYIYGPNGLVVDSQALLPDGSTHSAHFNGAFQSEFDQFNLALVRQLVALPLPSPASGFTYEFDSSTGTFTRSTRSFGPILAERADTIGRGKAAVGFSLQRFDFTQFDGVPLSRVPAVFTHDDSQLGGGRADVITTVNSIEASVTQSTTYLTYGAGSRVDVSLAVPLIRTAISMISDATIVRIGTASNPAIHFFSDPAALGGYGNHREFLASGEATGLGDLLVRVKATAFKTGRAGIAVGLDARLPTGNEEQLLGSGSLGLRGFEAFSMQLGPFAPHMNVGYQWNGATVLAGDISTGQKGDLPNEVTYAVGADLGIERRLSLAFDILGRHSANTAHLSEVPFTTQGTDPETLSNISFKSGSLDVVNGAIGLKGNIAGTMLVTFNVLFNLNHQGLRTKVTPLVGIEYGF
jgi:hypothetical protein